MSWLKRYEPISNFYANYFMEYIATKIYTYVRIFSPSSNLLCIVNFVFVCEIGLIIVRLISMQIYIFINTTEGIKTK